MDTDVAAAVDGANDAVVIAVAAAAIAPTAAIVAAVDSDPVAASDVADPDIAEIAGKRETVGHAVAAGEAAVVVVAAIAVAVDGESSVSPRALPAQQAERFGSQTHLQSSM